MAYYPSNQEGYEEVKEGKLLIPLTTPTKGQTHVLAIYNQGKLPDPFSYLKFGKALINKVTVACTSAILGLVPATIEVSHYVSLLHSSLPLPLFTTATGFATAVFLAVVAADNLESSARQGFCEDTYDYGDLPLIEELRLELLPKLGEAEALAINNLVIYARSITKPVVETAPVDTETVACSPARKAYEASRNDYYHKVDEQLSQIKNLLETLKTELATQKTLTSPQPPKPSGGLFAQVKIETPTLPHLSQSDTAEQYLIDLTQAHHQLNK